MKYLISFINKYKKELILIIVFIIIIYLFLLNYNEHFAIETSNNALIANPNTKTNIIINGSTGTNYEGVFMQIVELEAYTMIGTQEVNIANLNSNKVESVSAMTTHSDDVPINAIDGNKSTYYHSAGGGQWQLIFDNYYKIHKIIYYNRNPDDPDPKIDPHQKIGYRANNSVLTLKKNNDSSSADISYTFNGSSIQKIFINTDTNTLINTINNPPESQRSYSSVSGVANSLLNSGGAWTASINDRNQYMTLNLGSLQSVSGVITQGHHSSSQWVTSYKVSVSTDNITYLYITTSGRTTEESTSAQIFRGNLDQNTKIENYFNSPIQARYVRYHPYFKDNVEVINSISMRTAVLINPPLPTTTTTTTVPPTTTTVPPTTTKNALVYTVINPPEDKRSYSLTYLNRNPGEVYVKSMLDSESGWLASLTPELNEYEYMIIDLTTIKTVTGAITQGRYDRDSWITSYKVSVSTDNITYLYITKSGTTSDASLAQIFIGNTDRNTKVENIFNSSIQARYVKYHPITWTDYVTMRAGVLIALPNTTTTVPPTTTTVPPTTTTVPPTTTTVPPTTTTVPPTTTTVPPTTTTVPPTTTTAVTMTTSIFLNNQTYENTDNSIIENTNYKLLFNNNTLKICNKNTTECNFIYKYNGTNTILLTLHKEGYLSILNKDTNIILWSTKANIEAFFNISSDLIYNLILRENGNLQLVNINNNNNIWSYLSNITTTNPQTTNGSTTTTSSITTNQSLTTTPLSTLQISQNTLTNDYNIGMMLKGIGNKYNLNDLISKNTLLGTNLYISPMNQTGMIVDNYTHN